MLLILCFISCTFAFIEGNLRYGQQCDVKNQMKFVIEQIVEELAQQCNCIVFITDNVYQSLDISQTKMYPLSKYTILIRDNEEWTHPRQAIQNALVRSKASGCNAYVILIANGLLAAKFLQYIEEKQLVDTRGYFLLLHDTTLFQPHLHYIWNRMINVVFLRRYSAYKRRSGEKARYERIDLYTVYYPSSKQGFVRTNYIDTWYKDRFRYGSDHFMQKTQNLRKKTLRAAIFEHIPAVTTESRLYYKQHTSYSIKALGVEFELMQSISKAMNFKVSYYMPRNIASEKWGNENKNQTYTGLLREAVARRATFFLGDLHYTLHHLKFFDLSIPYNTECLTFLTPESLTENSWKLLILPFKLYTWIAILFTLILGSTALHLFSMSYQKYISFYKCVIEKPPMTENKTATKTKDISDEMQGLFLFTDLQNSILYTYSMLLLVSLPRLPSPWAVRVFIGWWWIYGILVAVSYRASMTATLANPVAKTTIDTLEQVAKSSIGVGGWSLESKQFFLTSSDPISTIIGNKFLLTQNEEEAIERVANGSFCYYENSYLLQQARVQRQLLEQQEEENNIKANRKLAVKHNLHIMDECAINMPVALGLEKNSPLKPHVDKWVRRIIEFGLVEKWLSDVTEGSKITEIPEESEPEKALVNLHKLHGALIALGIGYFLSTIVLVVEISYWKYKVLTNPKYDKYYLDVFYNTGSKP